MKVKDAMHKGVDWVSPDTPITELAKLMCEHDIGEIPIGENDHLIGMVTDRDIVCKGLAQEGFDAFRPTDWWIHDLQGAGKAARAVAEVLNANRDSWQQTSLWDDLAALFLLRPDIFGRRGGHFEPCVPAATVRNLLTEAMSRTLAK